MSNIELKLQDSWCLVLFDGWIDEKGKLEWNLVDRSVSGAILIYGLI